MKVLFIGNSHTFVHYVPARVARFCASHGKPVETTMLTHPGVGLDWHLEQSQTYYNLLYGGYDAVVLQHNAHPFPGRESLLQAGERIAALVPAETDIYLYMTWSEKNNPQGQEAMSTAYEELGRRIGATVCPVGRVWQQVRKDHPKRSCISPMGSTALCWGRPWLGRSSAGRCWAWICPRFCVSRTPRRWKPFPWIPGCWIWLQRTAA